jgi:putative endonuclease
MGREYCFWVYVLTNRNHTVLYIGVTNNIAHRVTEHRRGSGANFPAAYRCNKLIYCEQYQYVNDAIARESQLKRWSRTKKIGLINSVNPTWKDLGKDILQEDQ